MPEGINSRAEIHEAMSLIASKREAIVEAACKWKSSLGSMTTVVALKIAVCELEDAEAALAEAWERFGNAGD